MLIPDRMQAHHNKRAYRTEAGRVRIVVRHAREAETTSCLPRRRVSLLLIFCCSFLLTCGLLYLLMVLVAA